jgi:carboxyl-terminal processing protease
MRAGKVLAVVVLIGLGFLGGYLVARTLYGQPLSLGTVGTSSTAAREAGALQQQVIDELMNGYYKPVSADKLSRAGVDGTLKSLDDPYTVYLTPQDVQAFEEKQKGEYSGIGAALQSTKEGLVITSVFKGSPAAAAGLVPGDVIISVDGTTTAGVDIETSVARIKGEAGTKVKLEVKPTSGGPVQTKVLTRRAIVIPETEARMERDPKGAKVGYIQLYEFGGNAARDVRANVNALAKQGATAFILDLRYNGGGLLDQAVDVTGVFRTGIVTSTQGLHSPLEVLKADGPVATAKPLAVLVNGFSASASEIVTGALKDPGRAEIIGTQTFGKGLVQSIVPLANGAALKLTTAVYLTPNGTNINKKGIAPDIKVVDKKSTKKDEQLQAALAYLASLN